MSPFHLKCGNPYDNILLMEFEHDCNFEYLFVKKNAIKRQPRKVIMLTDDWGGGGLYLQEVSHE